MSTQTERLNPEPLAVCCKKKCTYPVCHCYDAETITKEEADQLLIEHIEPMLERLRVWITDLKVILQPNRQHYYSREQKRAYVKRKQRLQKNFVFWKIKYDLIKFNPKK
jgi:hypothetical protein